MSKPEIRTEDDGVHEHFVREMEGNQYIRRGYEPDVLVSPETGKIM
jgi:hypothetical protein